MALPMEPKLTAHYGTTGRGSTSPTARGSVLYDVLNKVVVDAQLAPISCGERTLAERHLDALSIVGQQKRELVLFDRGYPSVALIKKCQQQSVNFVMRVRRKFNNDIDAQTKADGCVRLHDEGGPSIKLRVIKFMLDSGEQETLITDVWDKRMGVKAFKKLYFMRWGIELEYDEVKNKLEIENFTRRSVQAIEQDFYATMYLTNAASVACWEAQYSADSQRAEKENKYDYQINVNHTVGVLKDRLIMAFLEDDPQKTAKKIERILFLLAKSVSEVRPDRVVPRKEPRNVKFHHNKKSLA
jgi:hypothetical protein